MTNRMKVTLTALAGAALLAGCATGPYYDDYGYGYGYNSGYGTPYGTNYYGSPAYVAPSIEFGVTYVDRDRREWRDNRREWRSDRDRDGRRDGHGRGDWRNDHGERSGG